MSTIGIIAFSLLLVGIASYFFMRNKTSSYYDNREKTKGSSDSDDSVELILFSANWCPHCKTAKPIWLSLSSEYETKKINGRHIIFTNVDCSEETDEVAALMDKYKIDGFPTIKLIKDGQVYDYGAKPNKENLVQFLNSTL